MCICQDLHEDDNQVRSAADSGEDKKVVVMNIDSTFGVRNKPDPAQLKYVIL